MGIVNVVNKTKYKDNPSIPIWKWQKLPWFRRTTFASSVVNWYWLELLSNSPQSNNDTQKFSNVANKANCFIRCSDPSCIGLSANTPKMGMISSDVSICKLYG